MKRILTLIVILIASLSHAEQSDISLYQKLSETIMNLCPDAKISVTNNEFTAKYDTMVYTLHSISKTGEVFPRTYQQEGPGFKGFILTILLMDGKYEGAAESPQTLQRPYYPTFFDTPAAEDGKKHYQLHFSYGPRLDPKLKEAIFDALPKTTSGQRIDPTSADAQSSSQ